MLPFNGKIRVVILRRWSSVSGLLFRSLAQTIAKERRCRLPQLCVRGRLHRHSLPGLEIQAREKDNKKWHLEFFDHMREGVGLICHCQRPCQAVLESVAIIAILLFVTLLAPILLWGPHAFPLAYIIDFLFGSILRGGSVPCRDQVRSNPNITLEECREARRTSDAIYHRFALFATPVCISFISYVIKGFVQKKKGYFNFISTVGIMFFALVFIPWLINEFLRFLPTWMKILVIVPFFLVWISFPALRRNATLMTVCYGFSFVIHIRVLP